MGWTWLNYFELDQNDLPPIPLSTQWTNGKKWSNEPNYSDLLSEEGFRPRPPDRSLWSLSLCALAMDCNHCWTRYAKLMQPSNLLTLTSPVLAEQCANVLAEHWVNTPVPLKRCIKMISGTILISVGSPSSIRCRFLLVHSALVALSRHMFVVIWVWIKT